MPRLFYTLMFLLITGVALPQSQPDYASIIQGQWVVMESLQTNEIVSPSISPYFKYEFTRSGIVYYSSNEFERGKGEPYSVSGDKLKMMGFTFTIVSYENEQLQITTTLSLTAIVHNTTLVRKQQYDELWRIGGGAETKAKHPPLFEGNFHLYDYVFSKYETPKEYLRFLALNSYPTEVPWPKHDVVIKITGVVNITGKFIVTSVNTSPEMNEKKVERLKKKIANTSGYWRPATIDGTDISDTITLSLVDRGRTTMQLKARAIQQFKMAYQHFQKGDYHGAILKCTDAISLDQTKFQFHVLRAVCQIKLGAIEKYCHDVRLANALNPFVSLENIEVVNGEALQITCGGK